VRSIASGLYVDIVHSRSSLLADLAKGRLRVKHAALVQALTGRFDDHHGELARILLDQIDALTDQVEHLSTRIEQMIAAIPTAQGADSDGTTGPDAGTGPDVAQLSAIARLDEIPGIGPRAAQIIIAEIGLDMTVFPTPGGQTQAPGRRGPIHPVIIWQLLADPAARYGDLGPGFYDNRISPDRKKRDHIHQLEALGYKVTLEPAA
jgi:hypothetical protein